MANNQRLIIGIAVVVVVVAVIVIVALLISSNSPSGATVASLATPTASQDENSLRTQVIAELTSTGAVVAVTNLAGTLAAMQETLSAPNDTATPVVVTATSQLQPTQAPVVLQPTQAPVVITVPPIVITATSQPQPTQVPAVVQPTQVPQQVIIIQPTQAPVVVTATPLPQAQAGNNAPVCLTFADLQHLGQIVQAVYGGSGDLAGAQIIFAQDWTAPAGWIVDFHEQRGTSVSKGNMATVWSDERCRPLQLGGASLSSPAPQQAQTVSCLRLSDLAQLGRVIQELSNNGQLAGAQIVFSQNWTAPAGWIVQKNGQVVTSVNAGDTASAWSPEACRPLAR